MPAGGSLYEALLVFCKRLCSLGFLISSVNRLYYVLGIYFFLLLINILSNLYEIKSSLFSGFLCLVAGYCS